MHLGAQELIVILLIVLVLFGGKKVAGLGKSLGTSLREFKEEVNKTGDAVQNATATEKETATKTDTAAKTETAGAQKQADTPDDSKA
nr:twin-arginine translocase TatA/TatE family subunit [uncultured Megasphaera sp.]